MTFRRRRYFLILCDNNTTFLRLLCDPSATSNIPLNLYLSVESCNQSIVFKKLPKSGICNGILDHYKCKNIGQKCHCKDKYTQNCSKTDYKGGNTKKSECVCVEVDPFKEDNCAACMPNCICTYEEFAVIIANSDNCKALERSKGKNTEKFNACPYLVQNPEMNLPKECFCQSLSKRVPPFNIRPDPYACCNEDIECIEHSELYCYCTNYINNTYVKKVSRSAIAKLPKKEFDINAVNKLCYSYGHPPDTSCHPFGYKVDCVLGFCKLTSINLNTITRFKNYDMEIANYDMELERNVDWY